MLADKFIKGAREGGHETEVYDVIHSDIRPCLGCNHCGMNGPCVQKDDYENILKAKICDADMLVFVMPVYYYNWPAQLKAVVDRFYSFTDRLTGMHKKTALLSVAWDNVDEAFAVVTAYYRTLCRYMEFRDLGIITGKGCGTPEMTGRSQYPQQAYELGKTLK